MSAVTIYTTVSCVFCLRAKDYLRSRGVAYEEVEITGDPALEAAYREWLPVVEIDGERAFVYFVPPEALRRKLAAQS